MFIFFSNSSPPIHRPTVVLSPTLLQLFSSPSNRTLVVLPPRRSNSLRCPDNNNKSEAYLVQFSWLQALRGHWLLVAINPVREIVYYLDSLGNDWTTYPDMKKTIDTILQSFRAQRDIQVPRSRVNNISWIKVECLRHRNGVDCSYFMLKFMKETILLDRLEILSTEEGGDSRAKKLYVYHSVARPRKDAPPFVLTL
ncbi:unnamed protein product [Vicia faba]|uniref:Ubiquitin-like protease family profile domain-containing protein n=1 Tax=Vicia faba TaxID=3906 RepID=A0AAV0ZL87_VICFA|nr:unnamed protein product [Vicia faba]